MPNFLDDVAPLTPHLVALRRRLHTVPEVGLHLMRTQALVLEALNGLDLSVSTGLRLSSVVAVLRGGRPGPVVLLRGDMDALPITESTGLDFASTDGAMHACGHDLHTAGLLGAVRLLHERRADLPGTVVFAFQPGEEGFRGAPLMLQEGLLDEAGERPVAAYAIHVDCASPRGVFSTRPGAMMASSNGITLRVRAAGGHAALPHGGVDPVPVAAEIILAIQTFVTRRIPVGDPAVISATRLASSSSAPNVMPHEVQIDLGVRALSEETLELVTTELPALVTALAAAHRCSVEVGVRRSYPVTRNDPAETTRVVRWLEELHGKEQVNLLETPVMASEDFSFMLEEVPGTLVFLGAQVSPDAAPPLHSPTAVFDDSVLGMQAATLAELAWRRLSA
ncbi:M20 family metallopeptidase [Kineosporia succinea]